MTVTKMISQTFKPLQSSTGYFKAGSSWCRCCEHGLTTGDSAHCVFSWQVLAVPWHGGIVIICDAGAELCFRLCR